MDATMCPGNGVETRDRLSPRPWHLREHPNPETRILGPLAVVSRGGEQSERMPHGPLHARFVKRVDTAGAIRVGTHVVESDEAHRAVERRVLHSFRHHRASDL